MPLDLQKQQIVEDRRTATSPRQSFAQRQAASRARAQAQQRQAQAAHQARIRQQRARQASQARAAAAAERQKQISRQQATAAQNARMVAQRRREQVTIRKGDTAENLADRYRMTPQQVAQQTKGKLVAGQVLDLDVPDVKLTGAQAGDVLGRTTRVESSIANMDKIVEGLGSFIGNLFGGAEGGVDPATGYAQLEQGLTRSLDDVGQFYEDAEEGEPFGEQQYGAGEQLRYYRGAETAEAIQQRVDPTADWEAITDRSRDVEIRDQLQSSYQYIEAANIERGNKMNAARYTGQAMAYAWTSGDMDARVTYVPPWMWEQFSPRQQRLMQEDLGYVFDGEKWIPLDMEDEYYGYGGYGDYGLGGGGGGGDYEPPRYTSSSMQIRAGGRVTRGGGRLTEGFVPSSHWRI